MIHCFKIAMLLCLAISLTNCKVPSDHVQTKDIRHESMSENEQQIRETIDTYFEGWMTGDTTKLGRAMHTTCQLKNVKENEVLVFDRSKYLSFFSPRERRKNAGGRVMSIDITNDIAAAKCEIYTETRLYTDYFNMMKINNRWYIVDKIATNKAKDE